MVPLASLWLPIVLSAVVVFIGSSILHMVLTYHRSDYRQLPDEDKARATLRAMNLTPGLYVMPYCLPKDMKTPAGMEKYKEGPVGYITIVPNGPPALPKFLGQWFVFTLVVSLFVAYLTGHTVAPGTPYLAVFRVAGTTAFMSYSLANAVNAIWRGQRWSATIKDMVDGLIYAMLTAGVFGWLWPR